MQEAWEGFKEGIWTGEVDVRDFIQKNYTPYEGDESFLVGPTERTKELWGEVLDLLLKEREQGGVLDMDTKIVTGIVSHPAGYIDNAHREKETATRSTRTLSSATPSSARPTTLASSMSTPPRCVLAAQRTSSPVCPMAMAAAASSATTVVLPCTVSTT